MIKLELTERELEAVVDALYWHSVEVVYDDRECARKLHPRLLRILREHRGRAK